MSYQNISIRSATAEELRLAALRQLIFEEPVSRLARLKKTIQRQFAKSEREKVKKLPIYQLAELHGRIFAPDHMSLADLVSSLVVSLALVLEDFRLYTPAAFSAFVASNALHLQGHDFIPDSRAQVIFELSQKLADLLKLGPERSRWLAIALLATIDWRAVGAGVGSGNYDASGNGSDGGNANLDPDGRHSGGANGSLDGGTHSVGYGQSSGGIDSDHDLFCASSYDQNPDSDSIRGDGLKVLPGLLDLVGRELDALPLKGRAALCHLLNPIDCQALLLVAQRVAFKIRESLRPSLVVLVEGQSELIVLPHFARLKGAPLERMGALVIASGGAKQVARRYLTMKDVLNIPIVCVFDGDAEDCSSMIEESLRDGDGLFCLEASELEDCYSYEQLSKILNLQLKQIGQTLSSESISIAKDVPRKNALNKLFRSRGLGDFDKIAFAKSTIHLAHGKEDVPHEMSKVIDFLAQTSKRFSAAKSEH